MNYTVIAYIVYLLITITITVLVANALFKNGKVFLNDIFHNNIELAESVNKLLLIGFYLVNIAYVVFALKITGTIISVQHLFETLSYKIGFILLLLGAMHFMNLYIFFNLRKKAIAKEEVPLENQFII